MPREGPKTKSDAVPAGERLAVGLRWTGPRATGKCRSRATQKPMASALGERG